MREHSWKSAQDHKKLLGTEHGPKRQIMIWWRAFVARGLRLPSSPWTPDTKLQLSVCLKGLPKLSGDMDALVKVSVRYEGDCPSETSSSSV